MTTEEKRISLYEIADSMKQLESMSEEDESLVEYLDSIQLQFNDKVNNIVKFSRSLELSAAAIDFEIKRLTDLKKSFERKNDRLKDYVKHSMEAHDITEVKTDIAKLSFRKSQVVVIDDENKLPDDVFVEKVTRSVNKTLIKELLDKGEIVQGAHIEKKNNLQIK